MEGRKAVITFLKSCQFGNECYRQGTTREVTVLTIGYSGGFERYPQDNTMDGEYHPSVIVEFEDGYVHSFELDYQIELKFT